MANENDLRILISASLNVGRSLGDLNTAINAIEKHPSLKKINLKIAIDEKFTQSISKFISSVEKLKSVTDEQNKVVSETQDVFKKLDGSISTVTQKVLRSGEVIKKTKNIHDENKKSIKAETDAIEEQVKSLEDLLDEQAKYNKEVSVKNRFDKDDKLKGSTNIFKEDGTANRISVNTDKDGNVNSYDIFDASLKNEEMYEKEFAKLLKETELMDKAHYMALQDNQKKAEAKDKLHYLALLENRKRYHKDFEKLLNDAEAMDRNHYNAIKDNNKRIEAMDKVHYLALQKNKKYDAVNEAQNNRIGSSVGNAPKFNLNANELNTYVKSIAGLDAEFMRSKVVADEFHGVLQQVHYRVKEGGKYWHNYTANIVEATGKTHVLDKGISDVANRQLSVAEKFKVMAQSIPLWFAGMSIFMGGLNAIRTSVDTIVTIDKQLTEMRRVVDPLIDVNNLLKESIRLAGELGKPIQDINEAMIGFSKQGNFNESQIAALTKTAILAANISDLSVDESMSTMVSAMEIFGVKAEDSIEIVNKLNEVNEISLRM